MGKNKWRRNQEKMYKEYLEDLKKMNIGRVENYDKIRNKLLKCQNIIKEKDEKIEELKKEIKRLKKNGK